ncbi:MAG: lipid A export permease/ATP-binding protein MsbA [bacterium]
MNQSLPAQNSQPSLRIYGRLLGYVKPLWFYYVISVAGHVLFAGSQVGLAHLMKYFVESLESGSQMLVYAVPLAAVLLTLTRGFGFFLGSYFIARVAKSVVHTLRCEIFNKMIEFPTRTFDETNSGHLVSRITYNVTMVTQAASKSITTIVREGLTVVGLLGYLFWMNWKLTLVFIALAPILGGVMSYVGKRMRRLSHRIQSSQGDLTHVASETINGFRVMRTYGGENYEKQRFEQASEHNTNQALKVDLTSALSTPVTQFFVALALGIVMFLVIVFRSEATVGELLAYITAAGLLPKPLRQVVDVYSSIQKGLAGAESIFEHLDQPSEADEGTVEVERVDGHLKIESLEFTYPAADAPALTDINLDIKPGESVAIVGRSGSGKSTLVSLIPRFYEFQKGAISVDGTSIRDFRLLNLRRQIALVTQQVSLFNDTIHNNIAYGGLAGATREEVEQAARDAYADDFIRKLPDGYDTLIGEDGILLSGGQRQRLSIARAILKDAPILILDEATSALDTESERFIQAAMEKVMKDRTTLVIAHRLSTIENADRIVVMDKGHIVEEGSHTDLIAKGGAYAALHRMQFRDQH